MCVHPHNGARASTTCEDPESVLSMKAPVSSPLRHESSTRTSLEAPCRWAKRDALNLGTWLSSPIVGSSQEHKEVSQADFVPLRLIEGTGSSNAAEGSDMAKCLHLKVLENDTLETVCERRPFPALLWCGLVTSTEDHTLCTAEVKHTRGKKTLTCLRIIVTHQPTAGKPGCSSTGGNK